jgi:hypothetical protein
MNLATFPFAYDNIGCVDGLKDRVAELGHHEALLQHTYHIADAAKVNNA